MSDNIIMPTSPPGDERSGEQRRRDAAIVNEILEATGVKLNKPANVTPVHEAERRLDLANKEVANAIGKYYQDHPLATNVPELGKLIMGIYAMEFSKWSKDDVISMLIFQQTILAMKKFGYLV